MWCRSVNEAKETIIDREERIKALTEKYNRAFEANLSHYVGQFCKAIAYNTIELLDLDHDAGDYVSDGGDYIRLLDWLEKTSRNYPIRIHSMNPVGVENMRRIIERNGWEEIK